ncbi:(2,3-dihydroxybenzoyl)adenylate synthase [Nocardia sp. FBN12]|uniref:(2,3-dihydroxybenzoyl)adenylate synthase n=1 Tax=Nocardia sp. FBN12 TaxID=3419766 RepID=UPI003CFD67C7
MTNHPRHQATAVPFPDEYVQRYFDANVWHRRSLADSFRATVERFPDRPSLVCGTTTWTFRELDELSDRRAAGLNSIGLEPGSRVLLQLNNSADTVLTWYSLLKAGVIPVCTLALHRGHEIGEIARQTQPAAHLVDAGDPKFDLVSFALEQSAAADRPWKVIAMGTNVPDTAIDISSLDTVVSAVDARTIVDRIQRELRPQDAAVFQLSGGTTGVPKVIPRLHAEYWYNAERYAHTLGWTHEDRIGYAGPLAHNAGIICGIHGPHSVGAALILGLPETDSLFEVLVDERATDIVLGGHAYEIVLDPRISAARSLERVIFSGKKVAPKHFHALDDRGIWAGQLFGMSEGLCMVTPLDAPASVRATTVGAPISPLDEVRILQPGTEQEVDPGTVGELCVRGPYTIRGYYNAEEQNQRSFTSDGFYRTGDLAAQRSIEGMICYSIEGRIKDLINRGGEKINAAEIELLLVSHPDITEAALVPMPDARLGERACAFVVGDSGSRPSLEEMRGFLGARGVAKYKWPERYVWLDEMPRSNVGKIDKRVLGAQAADLKPGSH